MFPMEFDSQVLSTLPLPGGERIQSVLQVLKVIVLRRVLPYFKRTRGTDSLRLGEISEHLSMVRFEDEENRVRLISLLTGKGPHRSVLIHERVFDYLSFVIPSDPESTLGGASAEERKVLAFAELLLRHQVEHLLYPDEKEREVILGDVGFVMERREKDPTFYRTLRSALSDEMNGIQGRAYLALFDAAEQGLTLDGPVNSILNDCIPGLGDLPPRLIQELFPGWDVEIKGRILGECYRRSMSASHTLMERSGFLRTVFRLFAVAVAENEAQALEVLHGFKDKWGLVGLFHELKLAESSVDEKSPRELLALLASALPARPDGEAPVSLPVAVLPHSREPKGAVPRTKTLQDRIEEARNNPNVPRRVLEVIDRNKLNAVGHSGSKYTEFIETLLAIPWGKIHPIRVTPREFEEGLNRSHYGLQTPKEILSDFFTNLIWCYRDFNEAEASVGQRTGSSFLLVGPPGVGKTSLAISVAQNLGIPYHKLSLGGMRDEADIRGHGFTYEGSKPGAIVQGLIKMEAMNGMFILDEADKTEKFALSTLLEILDPEQNHLFHDKYTQTTVDIDLSNCHFFLTANTLDGVPAVIVNRCEVVQLDRYSVEEKIAIARRYLVRRVRERYRIPREQVFFEPAEEEDLLRFLIRNYTHEAGVRELERVLRTLFLRLQRKEVLGGRELFVAVTRERIKQVLKEPTRPRQIGEEDAVGEMLGLGVDMERGVGSVIPIQATRIGIGAGGGGTRRGALSIVHATGNIEKVMDESRKVATTGILSCAEALGIRIPGENEPVHLHFMGGSTRKDGPSAGGAIALALASLLSGRAVRRDVAMTGEIDTKGRITSVGALDIKIETACNAGCKTVIFPRENLYGEGGIERFPDALKEELQILSFEEWAGPHPPFDYRRHILQVVAVENIVQAFKVAVLDEGELKALEERFTEHARHVAEVLRSASPTPVVHLQAFQVKTPAELDPEWLRTLVGESDIAPALLVLPGILETVREQTAEARGLLRIFAFEPKTQKLSDLLEELLRSVQSSSSQPVRASLVAPFFLLLRDGILVKDFVNRPGMEGLRLFANNYTRQGVKLKGCKPVLNRVYSVLSMLDDRQLNECPFLANDDGVYVVDLDFIPEKVRLDERRAEKILCACMTRWLSAARP